MIEAALLHGSRAARRSDDELRIEVMNAFYFDLALPRDRVTAAVERGFVIIAGTVERDYQKDFAEIDAGGVVGADRVINRIEIGPADGARRRR